MPTTTSKKRSSISKRKIIWLFLARHINFKMGVLSGFAAGSVVLAINFSHGIILAFMSFAKQFAFNVVMAGYNTKSCEKLSKRINHQALSLILASIIPTFQAFIILYSIHYFGGTPKPMGSTIWQVPFNLGIFLFFALAYRQVITIKSPSFKKASKTLRIKGLVRGRRKK